MHVPELHQRLIAPLAALGIPYMVTGGVAAIVYGEPRLTNDVDIVVRLTPAMRADIYVAGDEEA